VAERLDPARQVAFNDCRPRFQVEPYELTVLRHGPLCASIQGTTDPAMARTLYAGHIDLMRLQE
jgi:hypothetical protein